MADNGKSALGIYMFAGLFTRGLVDAGWHVLATLEDGPFGIKTHHKNFPDVPVYDDPTTWPLEEFKGKVGLMTGNPPCSAFSVANSVKGVDFPSVSCLIKANQAGQVVQPEVFAVESVVNMFKEGLPLVESWEADWAKLGYRTCRLVENGASLGLPQNRKRALFVAAKAGYNLDFTVDHQATPTTVLDAVWDLYDQSLQVESVEYAVSAAAFAGVSTISLAGGLEIKTEYSRRLRGTSERVAWHVPDRLTPALAATLPYLPAGKRFEHVPDEILAKVYWPNLTKPKKAKGRPSLMYRRLVWDKPCAVVTGQGMYFHPDFDRLLTVREQARMMGVPDDFTFDVNRPHEAYSQLGKAVSPLVGRWFGQQVAGILAAPLGRSHYFAVDLIKNQRAVTTEKVDESLVKQSSQPTATAAGLEA